MTAEVLMATPCTKSVGCEGGGHKHYHETCLALERVEESSAAVSKPRSVWLRMPIVKNLKEACRLPVRV